MKLRQKLAAVMATAMVVTAVPVITNAASTNGVTKVVTVAENAAFDGETTAPQLKVELKDFDGSSDEIFYLELENAKWNEAGMNALTTLPEGVTVEALNETEAKVTVKAGTDLDAKNIIRIPLLATVKSGDAKVSIVNKGNTTVSEETLTFATTNAKLAKVKVGKTTNVYRNGAIADIVIEEAFNKAFASQTAGKEAKIALTIQNDDFVFAGNGTVTLGYGFAGQDVAVVDAKVNEKDAQVLEVTLPSNLASDSIGQIKLTGIKVKSTSKTPETGDITIDITSDVIEDQHDVKVATVTAYGN
ncbi:MAG: hypothetical protein HUJ62_04760, partial [Streptococcus gallolyticus]|nr:hypothetical protein [Streptococcus gallolyticus]